MISVIPDYAKMRWAVRAPSWAELEILRERVIACFECVSYYGLSNNVIDMSFI